MQSPSSGRARFRACPHGAGRATLIWLWTRRTASRSADEFLCDLLEVIRRDCAAQVEYATIPLKLAGDPAQSRVARALKSTLDGQADCASDRGLDGHYRAEHDRMQVIVPTPWRPTGTKAEPGQVCGSHYRGLKSPAGSDGKCPLETEIAKKKPRPCADSQGGAILAESSLPLASNECTLRYSVRPDEVKMQQLDAVNQDCVN